MGSVGKTPRHPVEPCTGLAVVWGAAPFLTDHTGGIRERVPAAVKNGLHVRSRVVLFLLLAREHSRRSSLSPQGPQPEFVERFARFARSLQRMIPGYNPRKKCKQPSIDFVCGSRIAPHVNRAFAPMIRSFWRLIFRITGLRQACFVNPEISVSSFISFNVMAERLHTTCVRLSPNKLAATDLLRNQRPSTCDTCD